MKRAQAAQAPASVPHVNKWDLFRDLCTARAAFSVTDRDLTVLNALLSFHQDTNLSDNALLVVFPSNAALGDRAHGMAESTLRRHLAALVSAGLIARHDSPNGKRYAARNRQGEIVRAFGFNLRPLLVQARAIADAARQARAASERLRQAREAVTLLKRDAIKLAAYGAETGPEELWMDIQADLMEIHKASRRKLSLEELFALKERLQDILKEIRSCLDETEIVSGNDSEIERHYHNSKPDNLESELCQENAKAERCEPHLPLALVLKACPDILLYGRDRIGTWHDLIELAERVRGMMGISHDAWTDARQVMGPAVAAITVSAILQRIDQIKSPGGYLRTLSRKCEEGHFSPGPMIMALVSRPGSGS